MSFFCLQKTCRSWAPVPFLTLSLSSPVHCQELIKGEYFVLTDLLNSIPGRSSQAGSTQEPQVVIAKAALVSFVHPDQSPSAVQDLKPAPSR